MDSILILMILVGGMLGLARVGKWALQNPEKTKTGVTLLRHFLRK